MHPSIKRAYDTGTHPLAKHPVHGVYGKELANDQYENIKGQYQQATGSEHLNMQEMMMLLQRIKQREAVHKEKLEQIAIKLVASLWKAKPNMFKADLGGTGMSVEEYEAEQEAQEEDTPITPEQQKQIHKRITLNSFTHGAAIHQMTTLHHMVKDALDKLDPALMQAYDKLSRGAVYSSWFSSIEQIVNMAGQKGGDVQVDWPEEAPQEPQEEPQEPQEEPQEQEQEGPTVHANGLIFPILVHELAKGCMEVLTMHGLPEDEDTLKKVYKHADRWQDEVFHFFVGPALWRRFIKIVDRTKLPETISALSKLEPDDLHSVVKSIVENPAEAQERLSELVRDPEEYDPTNDPTEGIKKIAKLLDEAEKAGLEEMADPKTLPAPRTTPAPAKPDKKTDPYRPTKPAVSPKPKAALKLAADPKTLPAPRTTPAPTKPDRKTDPYRPTKPAVSPKPKAAYGCMEDVDKIAAMLEGADGDQFPQSQGTPSRIIYQQDGYEVTELTEPEEVVRISTDINSKWCFNDPSEGRGMQTARTYLKNGPLYYITKNGKPVCMAQPPNLATDPNDNKLLRPSSGLQAALDAIPGWNWKPSGPAPYGHGFAGMAEEGY